MKLYKSAAGNFTLDYNGLFLLADDISVYDDGRVNFFSSYIIIAQLHSKKIRKFAKAARKYDKKYGTDLIKEWGLEGLNNE